MYPKHFLRRVDLYRNQVNKEKSQNELGCQKKKQLLIQKNQLILTLELFLPIFFKHNKLKNQKQ